MGGRQRERERERERERRVALMAVGRGVVIFGVIPFSSCVANLLLQHKAGGRESQRYFPES